MNEIHATQLERHLGALTQWPDETPDLWNRALEQHEAKRATPLLKREIHPSTVSGRVAAVIAVCVIGILIVLLMLPALGKARSQARPQLSAPAQDVASARSDVDGSAMLEYRVNARGVLDTSTPVPSRGPGFGDAVPAGIGGGKSGPVGGAIREGPSLQDADPISESARRHVVRKSTMELVAKDVRAAFFKASMLISEANGEFVEQSSLTGEEESARANLTLRISVTRLSAVLNQLRELGEVESETTTGEDVTAAIVDLDARLANERQVEQEMLELLKSRTDAPLEDILTLREQISNVRLGIERLSAQREHLGRLVSLATILVIIKPAAGLEPEEKPDTSSIGSYFSESLLHAWNTGLRVLADTAAFLLKVLVGGVLWWIVLAVALIALRQHWRRRVELGLV